MKQTPLERRTPLARKSELRRSAAPAKRRQAISPASAQQKRAVKGAYCIACGAEPMATVAIDPAHLVARGRGGCDSRFCVVPLCRRFDGGCHQDFDEGRLDLLSILVADWGRWRHHVQHALRHSTPIELVERLSGARVQWSEMRGEL